MFNPFKKKRKHKKKTKLTSINVGVARAVIKLVNGDAITVEKMGSYDSYWGVFDVTDMLTNTIKNSKSFIEIGDKLIPVHRVIDVTITREDHFIEIEE